MGCKLTIGIKGDGESKVHPLRSVFTSPMINKKDASTSPQIHTNCTKKDIKPVERPDNGPKGIHKYCEKRRKNRPIVWR